MTIFQDNRELLRAFRAGDQEALATVYWHYVATVERVVRRGFVSADVRVPGAPEADVPDVLQDTFTRAFSATARERYDGLRPFRNYLLRIARNLLIDRARLQGRVQLDPEVGDEASDAQEVEEVVAKGRLHEATQAFVAKLGPEQRTFVRLRFEQERSQDAVAAEMGISRRRVRTLETRVRAGLRDFLAARGLAAQLRDQEVSSQERPNDRGRP